MIQRLVSKRRYLIYNPPQAWEGGDSCVFAVHCCSLLTLQLLLSTVRECLIYVELQVGEQGGFVLQCSAGVTCQCLLTGVNCEFLQLGKSGWMSPLFLTSFLQLLSLAHFLLQKHITHLKEERLVCASSHSRAAAFVEQMMSGASESLS